MYICVNVENYMMNCELGTVTDVSIFTREYYPHLSGYGYGNSLKPEVRIRIQVWAKNNETGTDLGDHYPHPNPAGAMFVCFPEMSFPTCNGQTRGTWNFAGQRIAHIRT